MLHAEYNTVMANLPVCLSHRYYIETHAYIFNLFTPSGTDKTSFFDDYHCYKIPRGTPSVGALIHGGGKNLPSLTEIAVYLRNGMR